MSFRITRASCIIYFRYKFNEDKSERRIYKYERRYSVPRIATHRDRSKKSIRRFGSASGEAFGNIGPIAQPVGMRVARLLATERASGRSPGLGISVPQRPTHHALLISITLHSNDSRPPVDD